MCIRDSPAALPSCGAHTPRQGRTSQTGKTLHNLSPTSCTSFADVLSPGASGTAASSVPSGHTSCSDIPCSPQSQMRRDLYSKRPLPPWAACRPPPAAAPVLPPQTVNNRSRCVSQTHTCSKTMSPRLS